MNSPSGAKHSVEGRILAAASNLFSQRGYSGVSTREIAVSAGVNEVTIYRRYPSKRDLYLSVLASELEQVHIPGAQLAAITEASKARDAMTRAFTLIETVLVKQPSMLRLILFGVLEAAGDTDALLRKHLGEFVEVLARYLDPWVTGEGACKGKDFSQHARGIFLALLAVAVFRQSLDRVFPIGAACSDPVEAFADLCSALAASETAVRAGGAG